MSKLYWSALAGALLLSASPAAAGLISFVSAKGVNTGDCSSPASPCQTLGYALSKTAASGEIKIVDPGNYVSVTINKSITITGVDGASINRGSAGNAITISAGASDVITIQNLKVDGINRKATNGVHVISAGVLTIKNCVFTNFSVAGISIFPTTTLRFLIEDSVTTSNALNGVSIQPAGGSAQGALNRVSSVNNDSTGLRLNTGADVSVYDSVFSGHPNAGVGIVAGAVRLTRSLLNHNKYGVSVLGTGLAESTGDNAIRGNATANVSGTLTNVGTQ